MDLKTLQMAWHLSSDLHESFGPPASEHQLKLAERKLGYRIPDPLRDLYSFGNGFDLLEGNLSVYPLEGQDEALGLSIASARLREWQWPVPDEVLAFGDNGSESIFGMWIPDTHHKVFEHPVVEIGEVFEPACMAVVGTSLLPFLYSWTAYYLMLCEASTAALDALGVPKSLRRSADELEEDDLGKLRKWADPHLPDPNPDPYTRGYDAKGLKKLFGV